MSATDNAFIKIYKHDAETKTPRPVMADGLRGDRLGMTVAASDGKLSGVVASTAHLAVPQTTTSDRLDDPAADSKTSSHRFDTGHRIEGRHHHHGSDHHGSDDTEHDASLQESELTQNAWRHEGHTQTPSPHVDVSKFNAGMNVEAFAPAAGEPTSSTLFQPAWEVDKFRWPRICDDLQRDWAAPLTGVVRSVVREAWRGGNIVAVTQFGRQEGATTLALCLARIAASFHIRVALVDANAQNPDVGSSLGIQFDSGWDSASVEQPLEECAIGSIEDRLTVLPLAGDLEQSSFSDAASRRSILERLAHAFELVVLDTGPVFVAAHHWFSQPCVGKIGSALIVRDVRRTEPAQLDDVCCRLRGAGIANMSVVENFQFG